VMGWMLYLSRYTLVGDPLLAQGREGKRYWWEN